VEERKKGKERNVKRVGEGEEEQHQIRRLCFYCYCPASFIIQVSVWNILRILCIFALSHLSTHHGLYFC
jgi:hypothetical protein